MTMDYYLRDNMYYNHICHTCKEIVNDLKWCSSCKTVAYCCKEHQISDWPNHRMLCRVIKKTKKLYPYPSKNVRVSWEEWTALRRQIRLFWEESLKRQLYLFENQMWMFPKVCALCFTSECDVVCGFCLNASYCSVQHQQEHTSHKEFCKQLRTCMDIDCYLFNHNYRPVITSFDIEDSIKCLPRDISELMKLVNIKLEPPTNNKVVEYIRSADFIAPIATLLYGLEKLQLVKNRVAIKDDITLHIIGAGILEDYLDLSVYLEFICHWIVNLKCLKVVLVGPELVTPSVGEKYVVNKFCHKCQANSINAHLEFYTDYYHNVCNKISPPDIMLLYNSGLHEFQGTSKDTWKATLPFLMNNITPIILTSYTLNEMLRDLKCLEPFNLGQVLLKPQKNPFMCSRPYRDWESYNEPVFYDNAWSCVIIKDSNPNLLYVNSCTKPDTLT